MARILLIGKSGSGKTTLVNKFFNHNILTYYGGTHSTKQVTEYKFDQHTIIDTPAFEIKNADDGSHNFELVDYFANLFQQYTITHILIIIRFQRLSDMRYDLQECIGPLRKFKQHFTVLITYWDECQNQQTQKEEISQKVQQWFGLTTIFSDEHLKHQIKTIFSQQNKKIIFDLSDTIFDNRLNDNQVQFIEALNQLKTKQTNNDRPNNERPSSKNFRIKVQPYVQNNVKSIQKTNTNILNTNTHIAQYNQYNNTQKQEMKHPVQKQPVSLYNPEQDKKEKTSHNFNRFNQSHQQNQLKINNNQIQKQNSQQLEQPSKIAATRQSTVKPFQHIKSTTVPRQYIYKKSLPPKKK